MMGIHMLLQVLVASWIAMVQTTMQHPPQALAAQLRMGPCTWPLSRRHSKS